MVGGAAAQGIKAGWRRLGVIAETMHGFVQWCAEAEREDGGSVLQGVKNNAGPAMLPLAVLPVLLASLHSRSPLLLRPALL